MDKTFALIGKNIEHSRSPQVYERLLGGRVDYNLLDYGSEKEIPPLGRLLEQYRRVSVTAPYKRFIFENCDAVEESARRLQAVNALKFEGEKIVGTNTDIVAFRDIFVEAYAGRIDGALILGDGAMSRLAQEVFEREKVSFTVLSRKIGNLKALSQTIEKLNRPLVVNTCAREYTLNFSSSKSLNIWDMNYSLPKHQAFSDKNNHQYLDGEGLLIRQAKYALSFWNL